MKPGEWIEVWHVYHDFHGNRVEGWAKAVFIRKYGEDKVVARKASGFGSSTYSRFRPIQKKSKRA